MRPIYRISIIVVLAVTYAIFCDNRRSSPSRIPNAPVEHAQVLTPQAPPERGKPVAAGDIYDKEVRFEFAVYVPSDASFDAESFLKKRVAEQYSALRFIPSISVSDPSPEHAACRIAPVSIANYAPPKLESLKYLSRGLDDEAKKALAGAKSVFVVDFHAPHAEALAAMKQAHCLMLDLANETKGFLWDEAARLCYSRDAWKATRIERWKETPPQVPDLTAYFEVHYYQSGSLTRLITVGMEKFGLPDVCVEDCAGSNSNSMCNIVNLVCQTMAETGRVDTGGVLNVDIAALKNAPLRERLLKSYRDQATGKAAIRLNAVPLQKGDANNRLLEIIFPASLGDGVQQRHDALILQIFGSKDSIKRITHDNSELLAAKARAEEKIKTEFKLWKAGLPLGEQIMVKAPFRTPDGGSEWMWVEVTQWKDNGMIEGILANDPFDIPTLKSGAKVRVTQDSLFDYIHVFDDGHTEGNETGTIIQRMEGQTQSRAE